MWKGYTVGGLATLTRDVTRTCLFDGFFSQTDVLCLPRPCGVPPLAHSASRSDVGVLYGQSVTYTCDPGFEETEVDGEKVCGIIDDCGGIGCRGHGTCVDLVSPSSARKDVPQIPRHRKHHHHLWSSAQRAGSLISLQACQPVQCNAIPRMKCINPNDSGRIFVWTECGFPISGWLLG